MEETQKPVGEVIQASTTEFVVQCHTLYKASPLGALVKCGGNEPIYGVVSEVSTQSLDPGRRPIAMGQDEETEEAVYLDNPQLNRLLSTELRALVVGYRTNDRINRYLSPQPPKIHSFVYECPNTEVLEFTRILHYLPILLASPVGSADDITASFLRRASLTHAEPSKFLVTAGKDLATLLNDQIQRLNGILRRLSS